MLIQECSVGDLRGQTYPIELCNSLISVHRIISYKNGEIPAPVPFRSGAVKSLLTGGVIRGHNAHLHCILLTVQLPSKVQYCSNLDPGICETPFYPRLCS